MRLDVFITRALGALCPSRQIVIRWIRGGMVTVNSYPRKPSYLTQNHDLIVCRLASAASSRRCPALPTAALVYDDEIMCVVNKPNHMVVCPSPHHLTATLTDHLSATVGPPLPDVPRNGLVHRLDQDTTGLVLFAKTNSAQINLQTQFRQQTIKKTYLAIVHGVIRHRTGTIRAPIGRNWRRRPPMKIDLVGGRPALTHFTVLGRAERYTLVKCRLVTGRTHQIRLHFRHIGHPVVGDHDYGWAGDQKLCFGQYLHAWKLGFSHPQTNHWIQLTAPLPLAFKKMLKKLKLDESSISHE